MGALASATLPAVFSSRQSFAADTPNETINLGIIGLGRQGRYDMQEAINRGLDNNVRITALCDVDSKRSEDNRNLAIENYKKADATPPEIALYSDFRELLERKDIDAVLIATPDHWHAVLAIMAAKAGKDIYLEKPMTNTITEGRALVKVIREQNRIFQLGTQQRSQVYFRKACELVRNGAIGKIHTIRVVLPKDEGRGNDTEVPVPDHLDYAMWLGPMPDAPYIQDRTHPLKGYGRPGWIQTEPYGHGMITNWGAHMIDIAQWGNGTDGSGLVEIEAHAEFPERGSFNVHTDLRAEGKFSNGVKLTIENGNHITKFEGENGWISASREKIDASDRELLRFPIPEDGKLPVSNNHMTNFFQSLRTRKDPISTVEIGHTSNSVCLVTQIAMQLGRKLEWDPKTERFKNDDEANALLTRDLRAPWTLS